jgi:ketosteroid isomerase-like protein
MSTTAQDIITRYFAADAKQDTAALVALFTDDAVVVDEAQTRRGASEIRAWRDYVSTAYRYTTEVRGVQAAGDGTYDVRVRLEGDFPGGTVDLTHRFTIDGDRISRLEIAP